MKRNPKTSPGRPPFRAKPGRSLPVVSLARALSKLGITSRKQARGLIEAGRVKVNGRVLTNPEVRVHPEREAIVVDGRAAANPGRVYFMMNKPAGYVTTRSDERGRPTVYDLLKDKDRWIFPVGRLDRESRGLLLFTNDTQWGNAWTDPAREILKIYELRLDRAMTRDDLERFRTGVVLDDGRRTRTALIEARMRPDGCWVEAGITEGKNRQIRRMMKALGYRVFDLIRTRMGPLELGNLPEGAVRPLTEKEKSFPVPERRKKNSSKDRPVR